MKNSTISLSNNTPIKKVAFLFFSILFWLSAWYLVSITLDNILLLPSPLEVARTLTSLLQTSEFYIITATSLWRITQGLLWGLLAGIITSSLASFSEFFNTLFAPLIAVAKATPVASFIILIWSFTGGEVLPIFVSAIIVAPVIHSNLLAGFKSIDPKLKETAKIFDLPFATRLRILYFPSVTPFFVSAFTSALGLAWKAGIAAEVLAYTSTSIGHEIYKAKSMLEMPELFAWTASVVAISMIIEYALKQLIKLLPRGYRNAN